jgi:serine/threonine-protein kinase
MKNPDDTASWTPESEPPPLLAVGSQIDQFVVDRILGAGSFGMVAEATDTLIHRKVAIKVLKHNAASPEARKFILDEARRAAALEHENIVRIYHVVAREDGTAYIVMQYVDGPTLSKVIQDEAPLPPRPASDLQVARG